MEKWQEHPSSAQPGGQAGAAGSTGQSGSGDPAGGELTSVRFAEVARRLGRAATALGLTPPAFRSPPKRPGLTRSIARRPDGSATVSVALRGRPAVSVAADMIDGIMAANESTASRSATDRDRLWSAVASCLLAPPVRRGAAPGRRAPSGDQAGRGAPRASGGAVRADGPARDEPRAA